MFTTYKTYFLGTLFCLTIICAIWCLSIQGQTMENPVSKRDSHVTRAIFQQPIDHFSNDARAMSPRDWGTSNSLSPRAIPDVTFDEPNIALTPPPLNTSPQYSSPLNSSPLNTEPQFVDKPNTTQFRPVEYGTVRQPKNFYENEFLTIDGAPPTPNHASPLPKVNANTSENANSFSPASNSSYRGNPFFQDTGSATKQKPTASKNLPLESRMEKYKGPANSQGISSEEADNKRYLADGPTYDEMVYGETQPYVEPQQHAAAEQVYAGGNAGCSSGCATCGSCNLPISQQSDCAAPPMPPKRRIGLRGARRMRASSGCRGCSGRRRGIKSIAQMDDCSCNAGDMTNFTEAPFESNFGVESSNMVLDEGMSGGSCNSCGQSAVPGMQFNPSLGFRQDVVGDRFCESSAEVFPFEENEQYPSMREILAQSVYFSELDFMFLQPSFGGNTAISSGAAGSSIADPFNFDLEPAFRVLAGFESDFGPGFVGEYFQFDNNSDLASFTSDGTQVGSASVYQLGPNAWTSITAANAGETLDTLHSLEVHSTSAYAFKAIKFKRASVNGRFGLQLSTIQQKLEANLTNGGAVLAQLRNNTEINAFGPRFGIDYFRRVGHTPMQLVASATGALLFGDRDQQVTNSATGESTAFGADEFITHIDIFFGLQMRRYRGEKRNTAFRLGFVNQSWLGGGTAIDPNGDFGFQGVSFTLGFNR